MGMKKKAAVCLWYHTAWSWYEGDPVPETVFVVEYTPDEEADEDEASCLAIFAYWVAKCAEGAYRWEHERVAWFARWNPNITVIHKGWVS